MRILQLNTYDVGGGAEAVASRLHEAYRQRGHEAWLAVKRKRGNRDGVFAIPESLGQPQWARPLLGAAGALNTLAGRVPGASALGAVLRTMARPMAIVDRWRGREDFRFPSTGHLLDLQPQQPDILQCHNLHGGYFDLQRLSRLSHTIPVIMTLHDCWPLSGHCAHSFGCERWRQGCGECPDLDLYPAIKRDSTAFNWKRKQNIYNSSRLFVVTPSQWLMRRVEQSMMMPGMVEARVIENSVDDCFFVPRDRSSVRRSLGIPQDSVVLLFVANALRDNQWKDFKTLRLALEKIAAKLSGKDVVLIALGGEGPEERLGDARLVFVPYQYERERVAEYYGAADLYLHVAKVETFSLTIAEAMASGTPVAATAVGAVPERIKSLAHAASCRDHNQYGADEATGILTAAGSSEALVEAAVELLTHPDLSRRLSANAARAAEQAYRMETQAKSYLDWFSEIRSTPAKY